MTSKDKKFRPALGNRIVMVETRTGKTRTCVITALMDTRKIDREKIANEGKE